MGRPLLEAIALLILMVNFRRCGIAEARLIVRSSLLAALSVVEAALLMTEALTILLIVLALALRIVATCNWRNVESIKSC